MTPAQLSVLEPGVAAQVETLPPKLDASVQRALPMLKYVGREEKLDDARETHLARSMTYLAASLAGVIRQPQR